MARPVKIRIGDILVQQGFLSGEQLSQALQVQKSSGHKLGCVLTEKGFVTEENLSQMLAQQLGIPFVDLKNYNLNKDVAHKLSETQACRFRVLVMEEKDTDILVGMLDPTDLFIYDELSRVLRKEIKTAAVCEVWYWRRL